MSKKKIISVFGTRPDAIKMAPLVIEIAKYPDIFDNIICVTGQHREMLDQVLQVFDIKPDYDLNVFQAGQSLSGVTSKMIDKLDGVINEVNPDIILVHGDTATCLAAALTGFYHQILIGHVEAGLRTNDKYSPFPEEINRVLTGYIANLHFAATKSNAENLYKENIKSNVYITGNTEIDALKMQVKKNYKFKNEDLKKIDLNSKKTIAITMHRRENFGEPMKNIFHAIKHFALQYQEQIQIIYAMHKNPIVREPANEILGDINNIYLLDTLDVDDMFNLISKSYFVMTDSGGLQESVPALGKPVLVCRTETERPEAVEAGTVKIVGVNENNIYNEAVLLIENIEEYNKMAKAVNPYGDGKASERIVQILKNYFSL